MFGLITSVILTFIRLKVTEDLIFVLQQKNVKHFTLAQAIKAQRVSRLVAVLFL